MNDIPTIGPERPKRSPGVLLGAGVVFLFALVGFIGLIVVVTLAVSGAL